MKKKIAAEILFEIIGKFPKGASLEEIMLGANPSVPRRTLQRWLSNLVKNHQLIGIGKGRAKRYQLPLNAFPITSPIPLSKEGEQILYAVSLPIQSRHPTSFDRNFLESYQPNETFYLPENFRKKMAEIGIPSTGNYPTGTYARQLFDRLLIDLSWNSSRLEGNTYSLLETMHLLEMGKAAEGKNLKETQMILNHKAAIEFLINSEGIAINRYTILNLHTLLSDNLLSDPSACGRLRTIPVGIAKSVYQPSAIPQVVEECFDLLLQKGQKIENPFEQAFFLMVHIPYLQPFDDVNKRTSRLAANIPFLKKNLCPLSFIDVPEQIYINGLLGIYELKQIDLLRDLFLWAYERSCALYASTQKTLGEPDPFRMKYREPLRKTVQQVVRSLSDKEKAIFTIRHIALISIQKEDQSRFIETVEKELRALHEGNIARYQLLPSEYEAWKKFWN